MTMDISAVGSSVSTTYTSSSDETTLLEEILEEAQEKAAEAKAEARTEARQETQQTEKEQPRSVNMVNNILSDSTMQALLETEK